MGRQIRFYSTPVDERQLLEVVARAGIDLLPPEWLGEQPPGISLPLTSPQDGGLRTFIVQLATMRLEAGEVVLFKQERERLSGTDIGTFRANAYRIELSEAPVIEFHRSWTNSQGILTKGRLYVGCINSTRFKQNPEQKLVFTSWMDSIWRWIRVRGQRNRNTQTYLLPEAHQLCSTGRITLQR